MDIENLNAVSPLAHIPRRISSMLVRGTFVLRVSTLRFSFSPCSYITFSGVAKM